jgi:hypothetical protein
LDSEIGFCCVAHDISPGTKIRRRRIGERVGVRVKWLIVKAQKNLRSCQGQFAGWPIRGIEGDRAEWTDCAGGRGFGVGVDERNQRVSGSGASGGMGLAGVTRRAAAGREG